MRVESTVIYEIEYFEDESVLEITFLSKSRIAYYGFPPEDFSEFAKAESFGKFYNERIKGFYDGKKQPPNAQ